MIRSCAFHIFYASHNKSKWKKKEKIVDITCNRLPLIFIDCQTFFAQSFSMVFYFSLKISFVFFRSLIEMNYCLINIANKLFWIANIFINKTGFEKTASFDRMPEFFLLVLPTNSPKMDGWIFGRFSSSFVNSAYLNESD